MPDERTGLLTPLEVCTMVHDTLRPGDDVPTRYAEAMKHHAHAVRAEERAKVVAWLRGISAEWRSYGGRKPKPLPGPFAESLATCIEGGQHLEAP